MGCKFPEEETANMEIKIERKNINLEKLKKISNLIIKIIIFENINFNKIIL